jgi:hypothetical protein
VARGANDEQGYLSMVRPASYFRGTMDTNIVVWGICFPAFLAFAALGVGVGMTGTEPRRFVVARLSFAVAALTVPAAAVYWALVDPAPVRYESATLVVTWTLVAAAALGLSLAWVAKQARIIAPRLFPGGRATPVLPPNCRAPEGALLVLWGSNVSWLTGDAHTIIRVGEQDMLSVHRDARRPEITVDLLRVFDDRNDIIARVEKGKFWVKPGNRVERRPDASTLVVFDHNDSEALRLDFVNRTTLVVRGVLRATEPRIVIGEDGAEIGGIQMRGCVIGNCAVAIQL